MAVGLLAAMRARLQPGEMLTADSADPTQLRLVLPIRMRLRGGRSWIVGGARISARRDPALIKALRNAHALLQTDATGLPILDAAPATPYRRRLLQEAAMTLMRVCWLDICPGTSRAHPQLLYAICRVQQEES